MSMWVRLRYSFATLVTVVGVGSVSAVVVSAFHPVYWGEFLFSPQFAVPVFATAFVLAPTLHRLLPLNRRTEGNDAT